MRSFARAVLRLAVALATAVAAIMLLVVNPLTRPPSVGEAALEVGAPPVLIEMGTDLIVRQRESAGAEEQAEPLTLQQEERLRSLLSESFTPEWTGETIRDTTEGMEAWVSGSGQPDVFVDLTEPKDRIRNHPDASLLVAVAGDPEDVDGPTDVEAGEGEIAVDSFLADLPDQVFLTETGWWPDFVQRISDVREGTLRIGVISTVIAALAAIAGVFMTPRPRPAAISSWLGWLMLWTAIPVLLLAVALPTAASGIPLPEEVALGTDVVAETWESTRLVGWVSIGGAFVLWGLTHVIRERRTSSQVLPRKEETAERTLVSVG